MKRKNTARTLLSLLMVLSLLSIGFVPEKALAAEATVTTGTTENFAILSGETITNTGPTEITGDVGLHPGISAPGISEEMITGALHLGNEVALAAKNDLVTAYDDAAGRTATIISRELGGQTLTPGVYTSNEKDFLLTGKLILDGEGDPHAVFIFQTDSTLITGSGSSVEFTQAATACGVFWKVGSSATLGSNSSFSGTILALTSITLETGAEVRGQLLARNGSVTLDNNKIISGPCASQQSAILHVIKVVVNRQGETATSEDFMVHVKKDGVDVTGSPGIGLDTPGRTYTLETGTYEITEDPLDGYTATYSGDSTDGFVTLAPGEEKTVIITNTSNNGSIVLSKTDESGNPLSGAHFALYKGDVEVGEPMITDEDGHILFTGLSDGAYLLKETHAPEGFVKIDVTMEIIVTGDEPIEVTFSNRRITGEVRILKVDAESKKALSGAEFVIKDGHGTEVYQGKTDANGSITAELPFGVYILEEVVAPNNYVRSDRTYPLSIQEDGQVLELTIENVKVALTGTVLPATGNGPSGYVLLVGGLAFLGGLLLMKERKLSWKQKH